METRVRSLAYIFLALGACMQAQDKLIVNSPDDSESSVPTSWWIYEGQTPADVANTLANNNARLVDLEVTQFTPSYVFTATYVANAGQFYKQSSWYYGLDATTLIGYLTANNARLTSLKAYDIGGGAIRFAAV